jgi:hypothetical protein
VELRRKLVVGTVIIAMTEQGRIPESDLRQWLDEGLTRPGDRMLFALPIHGPGGKLPDVSPAPIPPAGVGALRQPAHTQSETASDEH